MILFVPLTKLERMQKEFRSYRHKPFCTNGMSLTQPNWIASCRTSKLDLKKTRVNMWAIYKRITNLMGIKVERNPLDVNSILHGIKRSHVSLFWHPTHLYCTLPIKYDVRPTISDQEGSCFGTKITKGEWNQQMWRPCRYLDAANSKQMIALVTSPCGENNSLLDIKEMGVREEGDHTTPMTEEWNWTSERRRSSSALRIRCLELGRPSLEAIAEKSMATWGEKKREMGRAFEARSKGAWKSAKWGFGGEA